MLRALYSLLTWAVQPLLRRKLARRARAEPGYAESVDERFGYYVTPADASVRGRVWIHAVSLGETRAAAILLVELRRRVPGLRVLLTHGTATGRAEGQRLLGPGDLQIWQPWDTPAAVRRFLDQFQPRIGVLMETEVWPNLSAACAARGVPLVLANARLNAHSLARAQRLRWLSAPAYAALTAVWAQSEGDATRLRTLGAPVRGVFGNLKFDATPDLAQRDRGRAWRQAVGRPVILLASSREGEEAQFLKWIRNWPQTREARSGACPPDPSPQWMIVPRHPNRFDEVAALAETLGLTVSRRGTWDEGPPPAEDGRTVVWLGDSLGEMPLYYGLADVALLGGSFEPLGGQNLIEAAACGCPVILGPHTFNFAEAATLACDAGAALRVSDLPAACGAALELVQDVERCAAIAAAATHFAASHRGAAARTATAIIVQAGLVAGAVGGGSGP